MEIQYTEEEQRYLKSIERRNSEIHAQLMEVITEVTSELETAKNREDIRRIGQKAWKDLQEIFLQKTHKKVTRSDFEKAHAIVFRIIGEINRKLTTPSTSSDT